MDKISVETCLRHLEQVQGERTFAIAALRKIEAILLTPLVKGNGFVKERQVRLLAICQGTCADLESRTTL